MSYVSVLPATLATAATEVARIGSALSLASAVAAAQTSAVQAAAADEVSAAIAALFSAHGRDFQALSARAAAFHHEFVQALAAGAGSYAVAEIAAASPLQSLIDVFNAPIQAATGRPLIGNGANGQPGTGAPGGSATAMRRQSRRPHRTPHPRPGPAQTRDETLPPAR
ncbi:PE_PGRS family protein [Mycobacterium tuberculosis]|nr:PE_PGRS family protein [Mycobacterium tuberculosis]